MSNSYWSEFGKRMRAEALKTPCEKCGAKVGEPCVSSGGNPTLTPHLYRYRRAHYAAHAALRKEGKQ